MQIYDIFFSIGILLAVILFLGFLFVWMKSESSVSKTIWLLIAVILPILGPILYLINYKFDQSSK